MASLNYKEALDSLFSLIGTKEKTVIRPLSEAFGYVLSEDVICIRNLPPYNNSALDGYAIFYNQRGKKLKIKDEIIFAGVVAKEPFTENECYKIMTGAKIPDGVDTIVRFESAKEENGYVFIPEDIKKGDAFRVKGEECKTGAVLMPKGTKINAANIALLASQGISYVKVNAKPEILVLSTGNELKEPYEVASEDEFYNINAYSIIAILKSFGFEASYGGIVPDSLQKTQELFSNAKSYDMVISSGGVSAGEADFVKDALSLNGFNPSFTAVNVKPGKPTVAGIMDKTIVISLPGNPMAAFFNCFAIVIPVLQKLSGNKSFTHKQTKAINKTSFKVKSRRTNFVLGTVKNEEFFVTDNAKISSGMMEPLLRSNAILMLEEDVAEVKENEVVKAYMLYM
ncbi:MAG: molybdopterin molybdotransferase MoeA [Campylobacteraceae bacterium]